jgi:hypothetical protein
MLDSELRRLSSFRGRIKGCELLLLSRDEGEALGGGIKLLKSPELGSAVDASDVCEFDDSWVVGLNAGVVDDVIRSSCPLAPSILGASGFEASNI